MSAQTAAPLASGRTDAAPMQDLTRAPRIRPQGSEGPRAPGPGPDSRNASAVGMLQDAQLSRTRIAQGPLTDNDCL